MTPAQWRKLAASLPEVIEKSHFEQPDFRVRGKIFAGLSRDRKQGTLKLRPELQAALREGSTAFFPAAGAWGRSGWTHVELANVKLSEVREPMKHAWRLVAPKRLVQQHEPAREKPRSKSRSA